MPQRHDVPAARVGVNRLGSRPIHQDCSLSPCVISRSLFLVNQQAAHPVLMMCAVLAGTLARRPPRSSLSWQQAMASRRCLWARRPSWQHQPCLPSSGAGSCTVRQHSICTRSWGALTRGNCFCKAFHIITQRCRCAGRQARRVAGAGAVKHSRHRVHSGVELTTAFLCCCGCGMSCTPFMSSCMLRRWHRHMMGM